MFLFVYNFKEYICTERRREVKRKVCISKTFPLNFLLPFLRNCAVIVSRKQRRQNVTQIMIAVKMYLRYL